MAFKPGHAKLGGRRAGVPKKSTAEMRELAAQLIQDPVYQERLRERLRKGEAGRLEPLLWQYACGKLPGAIGDDPLEQLTTSLARIQARAENA